MLPLQLILASFCAKALAAPAPGLVPHADTLGSLQVLHYNNLGPENNGTSAVLVYDKLTKPDASARCAAIGEELYPLSSAPSINRTELDHQFDYLVYSKALQASHQVWVSANSSGCVAYSLDQREFVSAPCSRKLAALCTSRVPPTTDRNRAALPSSKVSLASHDYTITGYRDARSFHFLGIPFANPPLNSLRLAPPQPYSGVKQIDATQASASCIQPESPSGTFGTEISEDCLYLNVYTPVLPNARHNATGKPVAVYFYGGAFVQGSASMIDYDGGNLASRQDVLVVTVNYRLGMLGLLTTGNLTTGNYGTRDQILALRWVQQHIASFGGDPSRVTIFGQSAGGQSVVALLSSPAAEGLFSGAIVQSAPLDLPWYTRSVYTDIVVPHLAPALGCPHHVSPEASLVACLRSLPASAFAGNSTAYKAALTKASNATAISYLHASPLVSMIEPFLPIVDPEAGIIQSQLHELISSPTNISTSLHKVPILFTTVSHEAADSVYKSTPPLGSSPSALSALLNLAYPEPLATALINSSAFSLQKSYPGNNDSVRAAASAALTASEWSCPLSALLHNLTSSSSSSSITSQNTHPQTQKPKQKQTPPLYNILFPTGHPRHNHNIQRTCTPDPSNSINSTCHSSDVLPIWGNLNTKIRFVDPYYSADDVRLSQLMGDVFGAFFRTGDPNPRKEWVTSRGGEAYAFTRGVFAPRDGEGYTIEEVKAGKGVSSLGLEPTVVKDPREEKACGVFEEFGFTFERAGLD